MRKKLIAESFTLGCAFNKSCNITEFDCCVYCLLGVVDVRKIGYSFIRNNNHTNIRLNCAERVVCRFCSGLSDCVK